ncbi:MAG: Crp/Fnr family transcriptional regulator [Flavobacteriales bacterium]|nr:Crp/Fnr family transcriptional regulator [Flavobacteriales bacterium]
MLKYADIINNAFRPLELTPETHLEFYEMWKEIEFGKNEFLTEAGKVEKRFYLVIEGVQVIYILDLKGDKKVIGFSFDGSYSGVYDSYLYQRPSKYFLEALTPSKLIYISLEDYQSLFDRYPEFDRWGRIVHQQLLVGRVDREIEIITLSAKERFDAFMERCPAPLLNIPQKYLASYLNMTPETFSRMRAEK